MLFYARIIVTIGILNSNWPDSNTVAHDEKQSKAGVMNGARKKKSRGLTLWSTSIEQGGGKFLYTNKLH